jgi:hypothetical protein
MSQSSEPFGRGRRTSSSRTAAPGPCRAVVHPAGGGVARGHRAVAAAAFAPNKHSAPIPRNPSIPSKAHEETSEHSAQIN